ncbi:MAG: hypothetical protein ACRDK4_10210 [Solirubrobacteraceae bacterium]
MPVSAAAAELGVNPSRVRALISSGAVAAEKVGGVWLVDPVSLAARSRLPSPAGRPLAPANAWALLLAASGEELPPELGSAARWRVRRALESYGLVGMSPRLVRRAEPSSYWALPGELGALSARPDIALSGPSAAGAYDLGLTGSNAIDAYVPASLARSLCDEHALEAMSGPESNVILRVVPDDAWLLDGRRHAPLAAVAIDLASYPDPRAARIGAELVARIEGELGSRDG